MEKLEVGQQYRIKENDLLLTIKNITGENVSCSILKNNKEMPGSLSLSMMKSMIGKGELTIVSLHKGTNNDSNLNEDLMNSLMGMGYGNRQPSGKFKEGDRVIYSNYDNKRLKGTISGIGEKNNSTVYDVELDNGEMKWGHPEQFKKINEVKMTPELKLLESKFGRVLGKFNDYISKVVSVLKRNNVDENQQLNLSLIVNCYEQQMNSREAAMAYLKSIKLKESKMINKKEQLNETSFAFNNTPKFILNYEESDIVKAIKEAFKKYDDFTCVKISAVGDTQFYNVEVVVDVTDEFSDIESKRFVISQKIHKFRSELCTDLSSVLPVVNINLGNYEFVKNSDSLKFSLTLLMSATNQRDWVSGEYKKKDKKIGQKILDSMKHKELKESVGTPKYWEIKISRKSNDQIKIGTLDGFIKYFGYTLEVGNSYNKKISRNPSNINNFIKHYNAAVDEKHGGYERPYADLIGPAKPEEVEEAKIKNDLIV